MQVIGNFIFFLGIIAITGILVSPNNRTGNVINSLSALLSNSIKAAKH